MSTLKEKILETKRLEDEANLIRSELDYLQFKKRKMIWDKEDTSDIDERMENLRENLAPIWEAFEVSLKEIGESEYYNYLIRMRDDDNDRHKHY